MSGGSQANPGNNQYLMMLSDVYPFNLFQPQGAGTTIFPPHWHEQCLEIITVYDGEVELHIGGTSYIGKPGDIFVIGEGVIHSGYLIKELPNYYTILLDRHRLASSDLNHVAFGSLLTGPMALPQLVQPHDEHYGVWSSIIGSIVEEFTGKQPGYELAIKSHLLLLLTQLARRYGEAAPGRGRKDEAGARNMERLKQVISFIEAHYDEKITIGQAAGIAGMSPYHFCRVFKHAVGRTFMEYVHLFRVGKAEELIRDTDWPITLIAEKSGFGTIHYLDELFKRYRGCTPMQFRKQTSR